MKWMLIMFMGIRVFGADLFVYCSEGSPSNFSPSIAVDSATINILTNVYNRLYEFKNGETEVEPALAESCTPSEGGLVYTCKLRKGVKFHKTSYFTPTREMNADDVLFSFNRQLKKDHPYNKVNGGTYDYFESMEMSKSLKEVKKVDDYTVQFILTRPEAPFLANISMDFAAIISSEYADFLLKKGTPEKIDYEPLGTGPFYFVKYEKDQNVRLVGFKDYYKGVPKIKSLIVSIVTDPSVRYQKLKTGECHLIGEPAPQDLAGMRKDPKLSVIEREGLNIGYLAFNVEKKPFTDIKVRKAIYHALNRKAYIQAVYLGHAVVAKNPIPPTIWSYDKDSTDLEYSVDKAKKLLAEAGLPKGFETELWTLPVSRPYVPNGKKLGEMMQSDLAKVGIKTKAITYDWPTYLQKLRVGEHTMAQAGWTGDNGDPDNFLHILLACVGVKGGMNYARWCFKPFDDIVNKAKITSSQEERTKLYKQSQALFRQEMPWVPLAHAVVHRGLSKKVTGYVMDPFGRERFYLVDLEK